MPLRTNIQYEFIISKPLILTEGLFVPPNTIEAILAEQAFDTDDPNTFIFSQHQIVFNIRKSSIKQSANKAQVKLMNLDQEVLDYIVQNTGKNTNGKLLASLSIGDNVQPLQEIFNGTIEKVDDEFDTETRITTLTILDGVTNIKNAATTRSFARGTPFNDIAAVLMEDMKLPVARAAKVEGVTQSPLTLQGDSYKIISSWLEPLGFQYSIDKGFASLIPLGKRISKEVSVITPDSGLIGRVSDYINELQGAVQSSSENRGVRFRCLMDGSLAPEETVYLVEGEYDGAYKIKEVNFQGDFEGNAWVCSVVAVETEGEITSAELQ